jgi:hypothetical protein
MVATVRKVVLVHLVEWVLLETLLETMETAMEE